MTKSTAESVHQHSSHWSASSDIGHLSECWALPYALFIQSVTLQDTHLYSCWLTSWYPDSLRYYNVTQGQGRERWGKKKRAWAWPSPMRWVSVTVRAGLQEPRYRITHWKLTITNELSQAHSYCFRNIEMLRSIKWIFHTLVCFEFKYQPLNGA